jgi:hypothetical protein
MSIEQMQFSGSHADIETHLTQFADAYGYLVEASNDGVEAFDKAIVQAARTYGVEIAGEAVIGTIVVSNKEEAK